MTKLWKPRMGGKYWTYAVGSWGVGILTAVFGWAVLMA